MAVSRGADGREEVTGRVLVTGAAGFMGRYLMNELGMGEGDIACDVNDSFEAPPGVRKVAWRLPGRAPEDLGGVRNIVHLAAVSSVSRSLRDVRRAFDVNLMGTLSVVEYASERCPGARFLMVSSAEVYRPSEEPLGEDMGIGPVNPYGSTKAAAEIAALQMARACDIELMVARPFPHFGPGQEPLFALPAFCRRIIEARREGDGWMRVGNLSPIRDYLYVTDVARAYRILLESGRSGEIYNVCTGTGISMEDMVLMIMDIAGVSLEMREDPELLRPVDVEHQVGDPSKIGSRLGWRPEVEREEGMRKLFSWWEARA